MKYRSPGYFPTKMPKENPWHILVFPQKSYRESHHRDFEGQAMEMNRSSLLEERKTSIADLL